MLFESIMFETLLSEAAEKFGVITLEIGRFKGATLRIIGEKWIFLKDGMNFLVVETQYASKASGSEFDWLLTNFEMLWTLNFRRSRQRCNITSIEE